MTRMLMVPSTLILALTYIISNSISRLGLPIEGGVKVGAIMTCKELGHDKLVSEPQICWSHLYRAII